MKVYEYAKCSTCRKALQFLDKKGIQYQKIDITEQPPTKTELKKMLSFVGDIKKLFNTSGLVYKELGLSKKLPNMTQEESLTLLASNGRLIKRPFLLTDTGGAVGFDEQKWKPLIKG